MAWRRLLTQVARQQFHLDLHKIGSGVGNKVSPFHERFQSSYAGSFARRVRDAKGTNDVTLLKELYRSDAEGVIRLFESQPSLHSNSSALSEYVKALVKVDRLDESSLFKTLQRGVTSSSKAEIFGSVAALKNVGQVTQDGILGSASTPIHMVTAETGHFKEQLWRTFRTIALTFLLISGVGALVEDRGISKGLGLQEEVQPTMESSTKFNDVKGVDEAKGELEEIVHYLRDPKLHLRKPFKLQTKHLPRSFWSRLGRILAVTWQQLTGMDGHLMHES